MSPNFNALTSKQKKVYSAIETYIKQNSIPPTVREIGEMIGEKTPGAVQGILNRLEQKGVIKREMGMARSIKLVSDNSLYANPVYVPEIKKISKRNINDLYSLYNINKYQPVSPDLINPSEDCFMTNCPDNSLLESGIKYGDMLIVARNTELKDGDIVLVLFESHVLLRYYYGNEEADKVTLKAESNLINREVFDRQEVTIIGKLVGKYTSF
ncbi:MAG: transcriptional repressor LexA [Clostridia bacterium]|nr:transcriptional repressor LexA [Clostridia bacterium]